MTDSCGTTVTPQAVTDEGNGNIGINFFVSMAKCNKGAGRLTYSFVDMSVNGQGKIRDRNSVGWDSSHGNNFFLRDKIGNLNPADVVNVQVTDIVCVCVG